MVVGIQIEPSHGRLQDIGAFHKLEPSHDVPRAGPVDSFSQEFLSISRRVNNYNRKSSNKNIIMIWISLNAKQYQFNN